MILKRNKPMIVFLLAIYFFIVIALYLYMGGFLITKNVAKNNEFASRPNREFVSEHSDTIYIGNYIGERLINGKKYYLFQFNHLLKGEDRWLNILYSVDDSEAPKVLETNQLLDFNSNAILFFSPLGYYNGNNQYYDKIFGTKQLQNPDSLAKEFSDYLDLQDDKLFGLSLTIMDKGAQVELMMWNKQSNGKFDVKKFQPYAFTLSKEDFMIKMVSRKSNNNIFMKIIVAIADILSAPFQALGMLIFVLIAGVFGGFVK